MKNDSCKQIEELLVDFADGVLNEQGEILVRRHLESCRHCRQTAKALQESLSMAQVIWDDNLIISAKKPHRHLIRYIQIAAGVLLVIGLFLGVRASLKDKTDDVEIARARSLPTFEDIMPTLGILNCVYQEGDMEDFDEFCEQVGRRTGPRLERTTVWQVLKEMENKPNKTKGIDHENSSNNDTGIIDNAA